MSIKKTIQSIGTNLSAAYMKLEEKGAEMPENKNVANLAATIRSVRLNEYGLITYSGGVYVLRDNIEFKRLCGANASDLSDIVLYDITIPRSTITSFVFGPSNDYIDDFFLVNCSNLESISTIPQVSNIGTYFLAHCDNLNCPITIPGTVQRINNNFLYDCPNFNSPVIINEGVKTIFSSFMRNLAIFNSNISLPDSLEQIGTAFLVDCSQFNQPIALPNNLKSIGDSFMSRCSSFSHSLDVPASIKSIGSSFMSNCGSFIGVLAVNSTSPPNDQSSLATTSSTAPTYVTGVTITGIGASTWKSALPNRTTSPYRKLILS